MTDNGFEPRSCDNCGYTRGAGEISRRDWEIGRIHYSGSHRVGPRSSSYTSGRTVTRVQSLWICNECVEAERARRRRQFLATSIPVLVAIVAVALIALWSSSSPPSAPQETPVTATPEDTASSVPVEPPVQVEPMPPSAAEEHGADTQPLPSDSNLGESLSGDPPDPTSAGTPNPLTTPALYDSVIRALETGRGQRWRGEGLSGGVNVSSEQATGDEVCRNYRYTVVEEGETQTYDGTACKQPDGDWSLASQ